MTNPGQDLAEGNEVEHGAAEEFPSGTPLSEANPNVPQDPGAGGGRSGGTGGEDTGPTG